MSVPPPDGNKVSPGFNSAFLYVCYDAAKNQGGTLTKVFRTIGAFFADIGRGIAYLVGKNNGQVGSYWTNRQVVPLAIQKPSDKDKVKVEVEVQEKPEDVKGDVVKGDSSPVPTKKEIIRAKFRKGVNEVIAVNRVRSILNSATALSINTEYNAGRSRFNSAVEDLKNQFREYAKTHSSHRVAALVGEFHALVKDFANDPRGLNGVLNVCGKSLNAEDTILKGNKSLGINGLLSAIDTPEMHKDLKEKVIQELSTAKDSKALEVAQKDAAVLLAANLLTQEEVAEAVNAEPVVEAVKAALKKSVEAAKGNTVAADQQLKALVAVGLKPESFDLAAIADQVRNEQEIERLAKQIEAIKDAGFQRSAHLKGNIDGLQNQIANTQTALAEAQKHERGCVQGLGLKNQADGDQAAVNVKQGEIQAHERNAAARIATLQGQVAACVNELAALELQIEDHRVNLKAASRDPELLARLPEQLRRVQDQTSLAKRYQEKTGEIAELSGQLKALQEQTDAAGKALNDELVALQATAKSSQEAFERYFAKNPDGSFLTKAMIERDLENIRMNIGGLQNRIADLQKQINARREDLKAVDTDVQAQLKPLEDQLRVLTSGGDLSEEEEEPLPSVGEPTHYVRTAVSATLGLGAVAAIGYGIYDQVFNGGAARSALVQKGGALGSAVWSGIGSRFTALKEYGASIIPSFSAAGVTGYGIG